VGFGGPVHGRVRCQEPTTADDQPPSLPTRARPLEGYAQQFDALFSSLAQRRSVPDYLQGLLLPRDRNKTLTGLAGAEPITGAPASRGPAAAMVPLGVSLGPRAAQPAPCPAVAGGPGHRPHDAGVLVLDDTGDRKDGTATAHVARQYLGSVGKVDNGIVVVTSLWADERCCWPVHAVPYTPASRLAKGKGDAGFRTKPRLAVELIQAAQQAGIGFQAVVADCFYGDNPWLHRGPGCGQGPVGAGPQASQGHLGAGGGGPCSGRGGR
jgi:hypothetical protein